MCVSVCVAVYVYLPLDLIWLYDCLSIHNSVFVCVCACGNNRPKMKCIQNDHHPIPCFYMAVSIINIGSMEFLEVQLLI